MTTSRRRATLKDVAMKAGVHPATVSRALDPGRSAMVNEETRIRIQQVADDAGYRINSFARSLRTNSSGMVGVVVSDVANPFLPQVLRGIEQVLRSQEFLLLIAETHESSDTLSGILDHLTTRQVDAVILSAAHLGDEPVVTRLAATVPVVLAVRSIASGDIPTVTHDDLLGGKLAARHLVDLGHRVMVQLRGPLDVSSFRDRAAGFASVMSTTSARELQLDEVATSPTVEEGFRLASRALDLAKESRTELTAIFAHNDLMAVGALQAARGHGLECPGDLSIVGYNDAPLSNHLSPALTTVALPGLELGQRAAKMALSAISGTGPPPEMIRLPPTLVARDSTAPLRQSVTG